MSKVKTNLALLFLFSVSILVLTWCQKDTIIENNNNNNQQNVEQPVAQTQQKLVIHDGCVWCGRCVKNAPQNFTINWKKAQVSSQQNIDSQLVDNAIKNCPVSVIEIVEV